MVYLPPAFSETRPAVLVAHIEQHNFGLLLSHGAAGLVASHIPFVVEHVGAELHLFGHLARPNPQVDDLGQSGEAVAIFSGPHAYISPSWYASPRNVPTWNYIAVHAYGIPSIVDNPQRVREILETTVRTFEAGSPNPWSTAGLPEAYIADMSKAIVAFEMPITRLDGKRKLGQNRTTPDILGAADGLLAQHDSNGDAIAQWMLEVATERAAPAP